MAKVLGFHEVELKAGATPQEFERFVNEDFVHMPAYPGMRLMVLKGVRGHRLDRYLLVVEFENQETYQRLFPRTDEPADEFRSYLDSEAVQNVLSRWQQFGSFANPAFTDYVVLAAVGE